MNAETAVIGDIHGNSIGLRGLLQELVELRPKCYVFVGDYVNRGSDSSGVLEELIQLRRRCKSVILLRGNHDRELLRVLCGAPIGRLLSMGGAATLVSYVGRVGNGDLAGQLRAKVPAAHGELLRGLAAVYRDGNLVVSHGDAPVSLQYGDFHVYGHTIQHSLYPKVGPAYAAIDTGFSTIKGGRLSCLFWPSLRVVQVDDSGRLL